MNIPLNAANRVTILRIFFIPVFVVAMFARLPNWGPIWAALLFTVLAATDAVDGYLARSRNEVTNFGKLIDPLADKLLVTAALVALVDLGQLPAWIAIIIISREFIVTGLRMIALVEGRVIAAGAFGKLKTVMQIIAIVGFIIKDSRPIADLGELVWPGGQFVVYLGVLAWIIMAIALALTLWSMADYFSHARSVITTPEDSPVDPDAGASGPEVAP